MEGESQKVEKKEKSKGLFYIIAAGIIVAIVLGFYFLKNNQKQVKPVSQVKTPTLTIKKVKKKEIISKPKKEKKKKQELSKGRAILKKVEKKIVKPKAFKLLIQNYPIISKINKLKEFLSQKDIKFDFKEYEKEVNFKRIFVGPFNDNLKLIKMENKLKKLGFEVLKVKVQGAYLLYCGSFYLKEKAEEVKNKLIKSGIKDIVVFDLKKNIKIIFSNN